MKRAGQKIKNIIFAKPSILSKLMFVIMLTVTTTLILTGVVLSINEWAVFRNISIHSISTLAGVIGSNSTAALAFQDAKVGNEILNALTLEPEILLGCLYTNKKKLLATYLKKEHYEQCPIFVPPYKHNFETGKLSYSEAIVRENENYGSLYIVSDMHNFRQRLKLYLVLLLGFIACAGLVAFWIASRLQHLVTGPILRLAETARFISEEGKYSLRAELSTEVEINSLVNAFNRMLDAIQEREEELDRLLVSEREARLEAEKSIKMRDDFLLIASHELRTPITPIKIHFQLLKHQMEALEPNTVPHQEALLKAFNISERQLYNLEKLTEDLLSVSRILAGGLVLNREMVNLSQLVHKVLEHFKTESQIAGCRVNLVAEPNVIGLWDKLMIEQIVMNIFTNAIKYGAGKPIDVTVSKVDRKAKLMIRDYGIGITEENYEKIFQKFGRVASIRNFRGLGLGLYISKEYISAHNGIIQVKSTLDEGSIFTVELPIEAPTTT